MKSFVCVAAVLFCLVATGCVSAPRDASISRTIVQPPPPSIQGVIEEKNAQEAQEDSELLLALGGDAQEVARLYRECGRDSSLIRQIREGRLVRDARGFYHERPRTDASIGEKLATIGKALLGGAVYAAQREAEQQEDWSSRHWK